MANYTNRVLKSGHINVAIQIYIKDETGKFVYKCTTFDNPDNLTGKRLEKAAHAYGEEWERQMKMGKVHKYNDATFSQIADMWLDRKQYSMSATYLVRATDCVKRMKQYFGNIKFIDIKAIQVQDFFNYLNNYTFITYKAQPKKEKIEELNKIILEYGARRTENEGGISRTTLYYARKGETITYESAKIICNKFHLNFNEWFNKIVDERKYKKETILKYQRVLSAIFAYAIKIDLVSKNYATSYYTKDFIGGERTKDIPILSNSEYDRFVKSLDKYDLFQTIPLYLLATLGLRTCEVCGLKWEDVNFEKNVVSIKRDRVYVDKEHHCVVNDTKTKYSIRTINMCDLLVEKLKEFKSIYDTLRQDDKEFCDEGFIFCNEKGQPVFPHHLNDLLKKYLILADCTPVSCHKIRHSWITRLISNGAPVNIVSKLAGHAGIDTTLKLYTHYYGELDNSLEMLNEIFINQQQTVKM